MNEPNTQPPGAAAPGLLAPRWWQAYFELPPIGTATEEDHGFFVDFRIRLATESRFERDKWVPLRDASICIFNYGEYPKPPDAQFVENFIQNDVIGDASLMFAEPVAIEVGVEDDGSNVLAFFWNGPQTITQPLTDPQTGQPAIDPATGQPAMQQIPVAQLGVPQPIPDQITGQPVAQPFDEQLAQRLSGMGFDKWIAAIDNKALGDVYQLAFDRFWRKSKADTWLDAFVMETLKGGWNTALYEWDPEDGHVLTDIPVVNCFADPTRQFVWTWNTGQVHVVYRLTEAQRKWPQYAKLLFDRSQIGNPKPVDGQSGMGYQYDRDFQTRMVTFSITWIADQPKPMTPEEAIGGGHVEEGHLQEFQQMPPSVNTLAPITGVASPQVTPAGMDTAPIGSPNTPEPTLPVQPHDAGLPPIDNDPTALTDQTADNDQSPKGQAAGDPSPDSAGSDAGAPQPNPQIPSQPAAPPFTTRPALFLAGSDTEVTPDHPQWPMRTVLRRVMMLDEIVIEDAEAPWPKMEIIHATCIPVERSPYGFGLPWKARHAQKADSIMANSIANNCRYFGNPPHWMSAKMKARLQSELSQGFIDPSVSMALDDDDMHLPTNTPKAGFFVIPEMNEHHIEGRQQMQNDRKELGGYTDAAKGVPVTANASGELQKVTMQQAAGIITKISTHLQGTIQHLAELMLWSLTHYATAEQIAKCCRRYRPEVIAAIHLNLAPDAAWKVDALLASGAGQRRQQRIDRLQTLNQQIDAASGMPIVDAETLQEANNLDPSQIQERNMRALKLRQSMEPQQQQQAPPPPPPDKPSESINFKDAPPEAQSQMLEQAGIHVSPEQLAQHQAQQQAQQAAAKAANNKQTKPGSPGNPSGGSSAAA